MRRSSLQPKTIMRDYYEILDIGRDASAADIKKAYREKAMHYHPDRNPGDKKAEEKFKEAAEAYEVLSDNSKRTRYDRFGHAGVRSNGAQGTRYRDVRDIFNAFGDIFSHASAGGSPFSEFFGGGARQRQQRPKGQSGEDLRLRLKLTLAEVAEGVDKKVKMRRFTSCRACRGSGAKGGAKSLKKCPTCDGSGEQHQMRQTVLGQVLSVQRCRMCRGEGQVIAEQCHECWGEGRVDTEKSITVKVPAGVAEGQYLTLRGEGNAGKRGGPPGDLQVVIKEIPSDDFKRDGINLHHDLYISFPDAALGVEVEVPTLDGTKRITIRPGTQSGHVMRIAGKGLRELRSTRRGDLLVTVRVWTPRSLAKKERKRLEELRKASSFAPDASSKSKIRSFFNSVTDVFS